MTRKEYNAYCERVAEFMAREGLESLTPKCCDCPECGGEGGRNAEHTTNEPYFSWRACECCGSHLGGNREECVGYNRAIDDVLEFEVCSDCVHYAEYGQLDDTTMAEVEADDCKRGRHQWGEMECARFTGEPHRKCRRSGCKAVSLDIGDDD